MSMQVLRELLYGKGAHVHPLSCLEDLPAELARKKVEGYPHSILQIVGHMNYWMDYEVRRIAGEQPAYPPHAIQSWPDDNSASTENWDEIVVRFSSLLVMLETISNSDPESLQRKLTEAAPTPQSATVEAVLWQMVAHNSYHIGQIALIRRCLGIWPPSGGGDSW